MFHKPLINIALVQLHASPGQRSSTLFNLGALFDSCFTLLDPQSHLMFKIYDQQNIELEASCELWLKTTGLFVIPYEAKHASSLAN